jgi:hypothetical protein
MDPKFNKFFTFDHKDVDDTKDSIHEQTISKIKAVGLGSNDIREGYVYLFHYTRWKHDRVPLAMIFGYRLDINCYVGINLHYLHPEMRYAFLERLGATGRFNTNGKHNLDMHFAKAFFGDISVCYRQYKPFAMQHVRVVPISEFLEQNFYPKERNPIFQAGIMDPSFQEMIQNKTLDVLKDKYKLKPNNKKGSKGPT